MAKRLNDQARTKEYLEYKAFLVMLFNYFQYAKKKKEGDEYLSRELEGRYENLIRSINQFGRVSHYPFIIPNNFNFIRGIMTFN
ncbi:MAG: hypothetical protein ACI8UX_002475 [Psychromonas sp.]